MIFTPHHVSLIVAGLKTQTRRVMKQIPKHAEIGRTYKGEILLECADDWVPPTFERSPYYPGDGVYHIEYTHGGWLTSDLCIEPKWVYRAKWIIDKDYAVQSGYGKPGVLWRTVGGQTQWLLPDHRINEAHGWKPLRIRLLRIRQENVQDISAEDVLAEGIEVHDTDRSAIAAYATVWDAINTRPGTRWQDNPQVWVITFEVVK